MLIGFYYMKKYLIRKIITTQLHLFCVIALIVTVGLLSPFSFFFSDCVTLSSKQEMHTYA